jgi:DNA topoisomerase-6 subunit B
MQNLDLFAQLALPAEAADPAGGAVPAEARPAGKARAKPARKESRPRSKPARDAARGATPEAGPAAAPDAPQEASATAPGATEAPDAVPGRGSDAAPAPRGNRRPARERSRATAQSMAAQQREISVSEFFTKNRHLLGFDSPTKALLTTIKEAVDNSLDACEEAGILPDLVVEIQAVGQDRYRVTVEDNGPGIVREQIPRIFGKLLYGSKFHRLRQSRGQQGIGISAAGMYGQLTTGRPVVIQSRTGAKKKAHHFELVIDTLKNEPVIKKETVLDDWHREHGTRVAIELEGIYKKGRHGVEAYLRQTVLANPHVDLTYKGPEDAQPVHMPRVHGELPQEALEIQPHPYGVEVGLLARMLKATKARQLKGFFQTEFSRVGPKAATAICAGANLSPEMAPRRVTPEEAERLIAAIRTTKIPAPPLSCLSPIGEDRIVASLKQQIEADLYLAVTRPPSVYRGNPFQVEVGVAYGGKLEAEELMTLLRYANRVPLMYQQGACAIFKSVLSVSWRAYGLSQSKGALPAAPMVLLVHLASVWVPFTSESKEAIAGYDEIVRELKLALQDAGRKLGLYIRRGQRERDAAKKRAYIEKYIPHIGIALQEILGLSKPQEQEVVETLTDTLERSRKM